MGHSPGDVVFANVVPEPASSRFVVLGFAVAALGYLPYRRHSAFTINAYEPKR
jgi:hypothetical protein